MKVNEIKQKLDESGIEYDDSMKKEELEKLLESGQVEPEPETEIEQQNPEPEAETNPSYVVIRDFKDLKDNNTIYKKGDIYPRRADSVVDEKRIDKLMSSNNKIGKPLIEEQE